MMHLTPLNDTLGHKYHLKGCTKDKTKLHTEQHRVLLAPGGKTDPKTLALCWNVGATCSVFLERPEGFQPIQKGLGSKLTRGIHSCTDGHWNIFLDTPPVVISCTSAQTINRLSQILGPFTEGYPKQKDMK